MLKLDENSFSESADNLQDKNEYKYNSKSPIFYAISIRRNLRHYNSKPQDYGTYKISQILNPMSKINKLFQEFLIELDSKEFLYYYYTIRDSIKRLPLIITLTNSIEQIFPLYFTLSNFIFESIMSNLRLKQYLLDEILKNKVKLFEKMNDIQETDLNALLGNNNKDDSTERDKYNSFEEEEEYYINGEIDSIEAVDYLIEDINIAEKGIQYEEMMRDKRRIEKRKRRKGQLFKKMLKILNLTIFTSDTINEENAGKSQRGNVIQSIEEERKSDNKNNHQMTQIIPQSFDDRLFIKKPIRNKSSFRYQFMTPRNNVSDRSKFTRTSLFINKKKEKKELVPSIYQKKFHRKLIMNLMKPLSFLSMQTCDANENTKGKKFKDYINFSLKKKEPKRKDSSEHLSRNLIRIVEFPKILTESNTTPRQTVENLVESAKKKHNSKQRLLSKEKNTRKVKNLSFYDIKSFPLWDKDYLMNAKLRLKLKL